MAIAMGVVFLCSFFVGDSDLSPLENLEIKGKYISSLVKSILFGVLGGFAFFAKIM